MLKITAHPVTGIFQISGTLGGQRVRTSARTCDRKTAQIAATAIEREHWQRRAAGKRETVMFEDAVVSYKRAGGVVDEVFATPKPKVKEAKDV